MLYLQPPILIITFLLSGSLGALAAPQSRPDPTNFEIQPNNGRGQADDCGNGPISLSPETWASHGMDQLIGDMFNQRMSDPNFDFHQEFADRYGVDLYCPNSFGSCGGDPPNCNSLTRGTVAEKEQGWLGIKAMMEVQQMFVQLEKVASNAIDSLTSSALDFQSKFAPATPGFKWRDKTLVNMAAGVATAGAVVAIALVPEVAIPVGAIASFFGPSASAINDYIDSKKSEDLDVLHISDILPDIKNAALAGLEASHNATFSNGKAGGISGSTMKEMLSSGAFAGSRVLQAYAREENNLDTFYNQYAAIKLLESFWASQNVFFIYIPNVIGDCPGWHTNTGGGDALRFCGEKGMLIMASVDQHGNYNEPSGATDKNVATIGGFQIPLQSLYQSAYSMYVGHGLDSPNDVGWHLNNLVQKFIKENDPQTAYKTPGFFTLPVCELKFYNWKQSDKLKEGPPCDCLCATDAWGGKFMDHAPEAVQNWIKNGNCPPCK